MEKIKEVVEAHKAEKAIEGKMTKDQCAELVGVFAKEVFENHYNGKVLQLGLHVQGIDADENGNVTTGAVLQAMLEGISEKLTEQMGGMGSVEMGVATVNELSDLLKNLMNCENCEDRENCIGSESGENFADLLVKCADGKSGEEKYGHA